MVGSLCKVWCLHFLLGLRHGAGRTGRGPQPKVFLRVWGPMGPTRVHGASVCCVLPQDYSAIIELVETLQALPTCDVAQQHNVCFHYTFALNR